MNPEDFNYFQSRVARFISSSNRRGSSGSFLSPKITRLSGIIPKRVLPTQIFSKSETSDDSVETSAKGIFSIGRVALDLEIINNNFDRIRQLIEQDYKNTQEINRKEIEDYRKRVANRGRIFGKKELGDKKTDLLGGIKKYISSFFSGTGGAIRALAMWNLMQGLLSQDPKKVIQSLLGIGLTYIPAIVGNIVSGAIGAAVGGAGTGLIGRMFGGGAREAEQVGARGLARGAEGATELGRLGKLGRFGRYAAPIGLAALATSSLLGRGDTQDTQQQRLEDLTQQQKGLTDPQNLVPIPEDDLKRFENLNKRFEAALDFLMGKGRGQDQQPTGPGGAADAPPGPLPNPYDIPDLNVTPGSVPTLENFKKSLQGTPMAAEAESMYNMALAEGLNPAFVSGLAGAESSFGTRGKAVGRNNPFNYGVHNNQTYGSYTESVQALARALRDPQGPYSGERTLQDIINTYSPASENNVAQHIRNIMTIGAKTKGDPATLFIPRGFRGSIAPALPAPTAQRPQRAQIYVPPQVGGPQITLVPADSGNQTPSSVASSDNDSAISVDTTHPENFLALYSKLIYQVV